MSNKGVSFIFFTIQHQHKHQTMGEEQPRVPVVDEINVKVLFQSESSCEPDDKGEYPLAGTNSIYSAILSRNEAVKDAKRLKTFLELRDKYVKKKVIFEDPLFPANDSSLFYSQKLPMNIDWKRPSVSACIAFRAAISSAHIAFIVKVSLLL